MDANLVGQEAVENENGAGAAPATPTYAVCAICGKTLTDPESISMGVGPECVNKLGKLGFAPGPDLDRAKLAETLKAHYAKQTLTEEPDPNVWIKLQEAFLVLNEKGIPEARLLKAIGGERGMNPALDERFGSCYWNHKRWILREAISEDALALLASMGTAARSARATERAAARMAAKESKAAAKAARLEESKGKREAQAAERQAKAELRAKAKAEKEAASKVIREAKAAARAKAAAEKAAQADSGTGPVKGTKKGKKPADPKKGKPSAGGQVIEY